MTQRFAAEDTPVQQDVRRTRYTRRLRFPAEVDPEALARTVRVLEVESC